MAENFDDVLFDLLRARYDANSTKNENYAKQLIAVHQEFVERNKELTRLLKDYISQRAVRISSNKLLKNVIYWLFVVILLALTFTVIVVFLKTDMNKSNTKTVVSLLSVAATYLTSILSIVKIISKYLFPFDEEKDTIEMIKTVIQNDVQVEKIMSEAIDKSINIDVDKIIACKKLLDSQALTREEFDKIKSQILNL